MPHPVNFLTISRCAGFGTKAFRPLRPATPDMDSPYLPQGPSIEGPDPHLTVVSAALARSAELLNVRAEAGFEVSWVKKIDHRARNAFCPPSHRYPRRRRGGLLAPDGCR